jgi:hypothetical protein
MIMLWIQTRFGAQSADDLGYAQRLFIRGSVRLRRVELLRAWPRRVPLYQSGA